MNFRTLHRRWRVVVKLPASVDAGGDPFVTQPIFSSRDAVTRVAGAGDIRDIGSGNIGATNVLRTGRKGLAAATLTLDMSKGGVAALIAHAVAGPEAALAAGIFAVFGHNFPIWLRFKGGKGVATTLGVLLATAWPVGVASMATWLAVAVLFRYSSLAALAALALAPVYGWYLATPGHAIAFALLGVLGFIRHRANIVRLVAGEEPKIGGKREV
ncbi:MAG: glycerol-3-phosphate 1-O-acyltransferase PlsY [Alphaproteobacteria bacterium]|nr:glycerol-3-phosphate 1-O-acyltransferase PlsY [Alphaproteobacteria bacterium]